MSQRTYARPRRTDAGTDWDSLRAGVAPKPKPKARPSDQKRRTERAAPIRWFADPVALVTVRGVAHGPRVLGIAEDASPETQLAWAATP